MRISLAVLGLLVVVGCSGPKKPAKIRFMFRVDARLVDEVQISIGGRPVALEPPVANVDTTFGFVDFASSEIKPDAQPDIRLRSACGDRVLTADEMERKPPNESNVVVFVVSQRLMPESFTVAIDPDARSVKVGSYDVPASHPSLVKLYGTCAFTVTVDGHTTQVAAPTPTDHTLLVAASPSACLTAGVVVYATSGARCSREWAKKHTGQLAYWTRVYPTYAFRGLPSTQDTYRKDACIERGFVNRC